MKRQFLNGVLNIMEYAIIGLFIYSALTKIISPFEFQVKLVKASYLPISVIPLITWMLPAGEVIAVGLLLFKRSAGMGWMMIYGLMSFFNGHLLILHHIVPTAPCSCGGVLESIGFAEHFMLNMLITIFALYKVYRQQ